MLIVGYDSEYVSATEGACDDDAPPSSIKAGRSDVVCLTFSTVEPLFSLLIPVENGTNLRQRPTLASALARFFRAAIKEGVLAEQPDQIILASHWSRSDLCSFRDFGWLKSQVDLPGKSFATIKKPIILQKVREEALGDAPGHGAARTGRQGIARRHR